MSSSNLHQLTAAQRAIQAKRRAKNNQLKQVIFDDNARREFLTGFHKRKVARAEVARAKAKAKEKQERLEARRDRRRALREQALENAAQVEKACGAISDEEQDLLSSVPGDAIRDEEYENEEILATVTVVEDFDLNANSLAPQHAKPSSETIEPLANSVTPPQMPSRTKQTPKHKKIRHESKHSRQIEQSKQRAKSKRAELASGKSRHKSKR